MVVRRNILPLLDLNPSHITCTEMFKFRISIQQIQNEMNRIHQLQ